jgi:hypothetical protein
MLEVCFGGLVIVAMGTKVFVAYREGLVFRSDEKEFMRMYFDDAEIGVLQSEDFYSWRVMRRFKRARKQMGFAR